MDNEEVPRYVKRKKSSVSKSREKSKHKHEYADCLLVDAEGRPCKAAYCTVCGKVGDVRFYELVKADQGTYRKLHNEEIYRKYKDLPQVRVNDVFVKKIFVR